MPLPLAKLVVVVVGTLSSWFAGQLGRNTRVGPRDRERERARRQRRWKITLVSSAILLAIATYFWFLNDGSNVGRIFLIFAVLSGALGAILLIVALLQFAFKGDR